MAVGSSRRPGRGRHRATLPGRLTRRIALLVRGAGSPAPQVAAAILHRAVLHRGAQRRGVLASRVVRPLVGVRSRIVQGREAGRPAIARYRVARADGAASRHAPRRAVMGRSARATAGERRPSPQVAGSRVALVARGRRGTGPVGRTLVVARGAPAAQAGVTLGHRPAARASPAACDPGARDLVASDPVGGSRSHVAQLDHARRLELPATVLRAGHLDPSTGRTGPRRDPAAHRPIVLVGGVAAMAQPAPTVDRPEVRHATVHPAVPPGLGDGAAVSPAAVGRRTPRGTRAVRRTPRGTRAVRRTARVTRAVRRAVATRAVRRTARVTRAAPSPPVGRTAGGAGLMRARTVVQMVVRRGRTVVRRIGLRGRARTQTAGPAGSTTVRRRRLRGPCSPGARRPSVTRSFRRA
jgi:hypothetical protein